MLIFVVLSPARRFVCAARDTVSELCWSGDMQRKILICLFAATAAFLASRAACAEERLSDVIVQCAACHGADGIARSADVPHLAGQHELYLFNQLKAFRTGKRPHKEMRYMSRQISDAEMEAIARHYANMPR